MRWAVASLLVVAAGCASPPGVASVELGTGSWRFEEMVDGQEVELIRGVQGGWHMWVSVRARDVGVERALLRIETQVADESRPAQENDFEISLGRMDDEGQQVFLGWPEIIAHSGCLVGEMLRVRIVLTTPDGMELTDERYIILGGGADPPTICDSTP